MTSAAVEPVPDPNIDPPAYDSVADPPPSYDSIFGELQQVRQDSSGLVDFFKKLAIIFGSTAGCTVALAILFAIPIACIVMGVKYKDDCRAEKFIPIYLIVLGVFGIVRNILGLYSQIKHRTSSDEDQSNGDKQKSCLEHCTTCFLVAWFIAGNVWIYSIYEPSYQDPNDITYCNQTLYLFAFWLTTASYIFIGFMCCCMCCIALCAGIGSE